LRVEVLLLLHFQLLESGVLLAKLLLQLLKPVVRAG